MTLLSGAAAQAQCVFHDQSTNYRITVPDGEFAGATCERVRRSNLSGIDPPFSWVISTGVTPYVQHVSPFVAGGVELVSTSQDANFFRMTVRTPAAATAGMIGNDIQFAAADGAVSAGTTPIYRTQVDGYFALVITPVARATVHVSSSDPSAGVHTVTVELPGPWTLNGGGPRAVRRAFGGVYSVIEDAVFDPDRDITRFTVSAPYTRQSFPYSDLTITLIGDLVPAACSGDYNQDGNEDQDDLAYLVNAIAGGGDPQGVVPLDFTADGNVDQADVAALVQYLASAQCP